MPANEVRVHTYTDGALSSSLSYLTCDPPIYAQYFLAPFYGYDGDYPVYRAVAQHRWLGRLSRRPS